MARGAQDKKEWNVPGPLRALLWWPGVAFVLVLVDPGNIAWTIGLAGLVLVGLGFVMPPFMRRLRRMAASATTKMVAEAPTMEIDMPTMEIPQVNRAA